MVLSCAGSPMDKSAMGLLAFLRLCISWLHLVALAFTYDRSRRLSGTKSFTERQRCKASTVSNCGPCVPEKLGLTGAAHRGSRALPMLEGAMKHRLRRTTLGLVTCVILPASRNVDRSPHLSAPALAPSGPRPASAARPACPESIPT